MVVGHRAGLDDGAFVEEAEGAKANCPVSKALAGVPEITLDARSRRRTAAARSLRGLALHSARWPTSGRISSTSSSARTRSCRSGCPTRPSTTTTARRPTLGRRLKELEPAVQAGAGVAAGAAPISPTAKDDPELAAMAADLEADVARLEEELRLALVERDPADEKDVIVEVRQGVGGDEAALWAGEVCRMLPRYAERRGFRTEILSASENETGGFKEVVFAVKGDGAYSVFKYEGGTHRVQRVPETESQGRIHTSTATVAVMPEVEDVEVGSTRRTSRSTSTGRPAPAGRASTRPTRPCGSRTCRRGSSSRCRTRSRSSRTSRRRCACSVRGCTRPSGSGSRPRSAAARSSQVGTGERAEKIRTYNFPENRLTDHRIKLTAHRLDQILDGDLEEFTDALQAEERRRALEAAV